MRSSIIIPLNNIKLSWLVVSTPLKNTLLVGGFNPPEKYITGWWFQPP
jgi:hypothetical protein